jgi:hypothetical protein
VPAAADIIRQAADLNRKDDRRHGSTVRLEGRYDLIIAGDIHGNRPNFVKIVGYAELASNPGRHLLLQELIHGPVDPASGHDRSIELLLRAARLKCSHERQVLFVIGNHDVAQITGSEIIKDGQSFCETFAEGVSYAFGAADAPAILAAVEEFLLSLPLAVVCDNGVMIAHSVPSPNRMAPAGTEILTRAFTKDDLHRGTPVYDWTWGRGHAAEQLDSLAAKLGVDFLILGHQRSDSGLEVISPRAVALASDHAHGKILHFSGGETVSTETAMAKARPIVTLAANA